MPKLVERLTALGSRALPRDTATRVLGLTEDSLKAEMKPVPEGTFRRLKSLIEDAKRALGRRAAVDEMFPLSDDMSLLGCRRALT